MLFFGLLEIVKNYYKIFLVVFVIIIMRGFGGLFFYGISDRVERFGVVFGVICKFGRKFFFIGFYIFNFVELIGFN